MEDYSYWSAIVQLGFLCLALIIGNTLRRKVPILNKSLLPSAVIGGILILIFKTIPAFDKLINPSFMEGITYHCLAIGFIALTLKEKDNSKTGGMIVVKTGAVVVNTYIVQAIVGLTVTILLSLVMTNVLPASGLLMMLGFGQGPGQALNFGITYEDNYNFVGGRTFGLTLASIGFLVACIVGVIAINIFKKQGKLRDVSTKDKTFQSVQEVSNPNDIPLSESVDKFTVNVSIVLITYLATYGFMAGVSVLCGYLGKFGVNTVRPLIWGFNFLFGTLFALLAKVVMKFFKKIRFQSRNYTNNFMLNRISGLVFDIMILAGISAIEFEHLKGLWLPIILLAVVGTLFTFVYLSFICKRLYPEYRYEAWASLFGMLTGTASTGTILLREVDPQFETPASNNLIMQTVPAIAFGFPILLLVGFAPQSLLHSIITVGIVTVLFFAFNVFILFKKKPKMDAPIKNLDE